MNYDAPYQSVLGFAKIPDRKSEEFRILTPNGPMELFLMSGFPRWVITKQVITE